MDKPFKPSIVQVYLEASSKEEVIKLQYLNNLKNGKMYDYARPVKEGKKWIVWYYADVLSDKPINLKLEVPSGNST